MNILTYPELRTFRTEQSELTCGNVLSGYLVLFTRKLPLSFRGEKHQNHNTPAHTNEPTDSGSNTKTNWKTQEHCDTRLRYICVPTGTLTFSLFA
jgi:hypothetical protein